MGKMRRFGELKRMRVHALYNEGVGSLRDIFFDDAWLIRYLVVDADDAGWINRQIVLLAPEAIRPLADDAPAIETRLNIDMIRAAPPVHADAAPSLEIEARLAAHYGWYPYWADRKTTRNAGLFSLEQHLHQRVEAADGDAGILRDALIDPVSWRISHLIAEDGGFLHARPILLDTDTVTTLSPESDHLCLRMSRAAVRSLPRFDPYGPDLAVSG